MKYTIDNTYVFPNVARELGARTSMFAEKATNYYANGSEIVVPMIQITDGWEGDKELEDLVKLLDYVDLFVTHDMVTVTCRDLYEIGRDVANGKIDINSLF